MPMPDLFTTFPRDPFVGFPSLPSVKEPAIGKNAPPERANFAEQPASPTVAAPAFALPAWALAASEFTRAVSEVPSSLPDLSPAQGMAFNPDFLNNMGLPPEIVGALTFVLAFGKMPIAAVTFGSLALYYKAANRPRRQLNEHILETNRALPPLLALPRPERIDSPEDARAVCTLIRILHPYAAPHPLEAQGRARRGQKPLLARHACTRSLHDTLEWPREKALRFLRRQDEKMGPNERLNRETDLSEIGAKVREAAAKIMRYPSWAKNLWNRARVWKRGEKWAPEHPLYVPGDFGENIDALLKNLKRELRDFKQKIIRNAIVVSEGRLDIADYTAPELTPESVSETARELGARITGRLAFLGTVVGDPRAWRHLDAMEKKNIADEIALYEDTLRYPDGYAAVDAYRGLCLEAIFALRRRQTEMS